MEEGDLRTPGMGKLAGASPFGEMKGEGEIGRKGQFGKHSVICGQSKNIGQSRKRGTRNLDLGFNGNYMHLYGT